MKTEIFFIDSFDKDRNFYFNFIFNLDKLNSKPIQGRLDHNILYDEKLNRFFPITHEVSNFTIEDNTLFGTVTFYDTVKSKILKKLLETKKIVLRPIGSITRINNSRQIFNFDIARIDAKLIEDDYISKSNNYDAE